MASIKILNQTYRLPAIATKRFCALQDQVQAQQQIIQTGLRPQPRLLGVIPRQPLTLTLDERWQELDLLVRNYNDIIAELCASKDAYEAFFGQLAAGVQQALVRQSEAMRREEEELLADAQRPKIQQDETLQRLVHEDGEHLMRGVRLLGQAALLLLKKIALCQEGLARLVTDQELQQRVLTELTERLELHRYAYLRRQRIVQLVKGVASMTKVALHFEDYVRDHLGPLQGLLEQVVHVESDLHRAVAEIEALTRQLEQQRLLTPLPGGEMLDERWLKFLTTSQLKKDRLVEMWERLERQDGALEALDIDIATIASNAASPVLTALDNIRTLVEVRLAPLVSEHVMTESEPPQAVPIPVLVEAEQLGSRIADTFDTLFGLDIRQAIPSNNYGALMQHTNDKGSGTSLTVHWLSELIEQHVRVYERLRLTSGLCESQEEAEAWLKAVLRVFCERAHAHFPPNAVKRINRAVSLEQRRPIDLSDRDFVTDHCYLTRGDVIRIWQAHPGLGWEDKKGTRVYESADRRRAAWEEHCRSVAEIRAVLTLSSTPAQAVSEAVDRLTSQNYRRKREEGGLGLSILHDASGEKWRFTHCYSCQMALQTGPFLECTQCGWLVCSCGACGCGYLGQQPSIVPS